MLNAVHKHFQRTLGRDHPDTFSAGDKLAAACAASGHFERAERLYAHHLRCLDASEGSGHPATLHAMMNLGNKMMPHRPLVNAYTTNRYISLYFTHMYNHLSTPPSTL